MYFNSLDFFAFFVVVYGLYLVLDHKWQNRMLLVASYFFYGLWNWKFLSLLWISSLVDYFCGIKVSESRSLGRRRLFLWTSIICNLGMLGFFKYSGFFIDSFSHLLSAIGFQPNEWSLKVILPVGISFYTFQTMSYTIDIYRRKMEPTRNFADFALFVSFFPQLVAGPIERAKRLLPQISKERSLNISQMKEGCFLIAWGLFKKVIIADNLAIIVNQQLGNCGNAGFWEIMLAMYAFSGQLYGDFSGYSDIARGLAKLMGFELMENFHLPYFAVRPTEFWAKWHISLTSWVRDYFYLSLGSTRRGNLKAARDNIMAMTLIGLWHGAKWTFVLWGFMFGLVQAGYILIRPYLKKFIKPITDNQKLLVKLVSMFLMYHTFIMSGFLFRAESLHQTVVMFKCLGRYFVPDSLDIKRAMVVMFFNVPIISMQIAQYRSQDMLVLLKQKNIVRFFCYAAAVIMIVAVYLFGANVKGGEEFIYFQF